VWRLLAACAAAIGLVVGCSVSASPGPPSSATGSQMPAAVSAAPSAAASSTPLLVTPMPASSPTSRVASSSGGAPTAASSPTVRVLGLDAILNVAEGERFETFGGEAIRLESVWSPFDPGLGGTCPPSDAWLECGLEDWLIQPSPEHDGPTYDGPRLDLFYAPGVRERLGRDLHGGEGPLDVVGHFGDPASQECRPANRNACRDLFVVTAIDRDP
jgi:hypothetical protein